MILAFGNTSLRYFLGEETGIMAKTEEVKTQWVEKFGCWICWCIHPASVLHHRENMDLFKSGIKNFSEKVSILGGY